VDERRCLPFHDRRDTRRKSIRRVLVILGSYGAKFPSGPARVGKLLVFSTWMPAS